MSLHVLLCVNCSYFLLYFLLNLTCKFLGDSKDSGNFYLVPTVPCLKKNLFHLWKGIWQSHSMSKAIGTGQVNKNLFILAGSIFHHIWLVKHQIVRATFQTQKIAVNTKFWRKKIYTNRVRLTILKTKDKSPLASKIGVRNFVLFIVMCQWHAKGFTSLSFNLHDDLWSGYYYSTPFHR